MKLLPFALFLAAQCVLWGRVAVAEELAYRPAPADNPLKGFVPYAGNYSTFPHSMEWFSLPLKDLQKGYDRFDWKPLDEQLNAIAKRGNQAAFRIYLDYPNLDYGVPEFLSSVPKHAYNDEGNGSKQTSFSPDYEDPNLRRALQNFLHAFGARYDGDARIGFITVGLLGFWGEWHTYPHPWMASPMVENEVLNAYEAAFQKTKILLREPKSDIDIGRRKVGFHDVSFAVQTLGPTEWHFLPTLNRFGVAERWKTFPIGGEVRPDIQRTLFDVPTGAPAGQEFEECVAQTHTSWLINQQVFENVSGESKIRAIEGAARMGYEFHVVSSQISADSKRPGPLQISLEIRDTGVAPFYYDWPVELGILRPDGSIFQWKTPCNLAGILPTASTAPPTRWSFQVPFTVAKNGNYSVLMRVLNPLPGGKTLRFANTDQDRQRRNWLSLGTIRLAVRKLK